MSKKYVMLDLDDEKLNVLADVLSNKTSKKILEYIAEKELSETEIARDLNLPANTVNYNIKKLLESGLIEIAKDFFWSVKGKKILRYRVANKKILISPKSSKNSIGILSALILTGISAFFVKVYTSSFKSKGLEVFADGSSGAAGLDAGIESVKFAAQPSVQNAIDSTFQLPEIWVWFLLGGIIALVFYMILNWRKL